MIEVVEVLADLGDDGVAGDRRTVAVIDEQPGRLVVDDAMGERFGLLADVELIGAERTLGQALEDTSKIRRKHLRFGVVRSAVTRWALPH